MNGPRPTFWLSMHLPYACRHSGACCSAGWPIPLERTRVDAVRVLRRDESWLQPLPRGRFESAAANVAGVLDVSKNGHCVFHRGGRAGCEIHRAFGHAALPTACQHFPRQVLLDPRGVFVTLSHYCPTALDLLFTHVGPVSIVEGPPALPAGEPEGLDARDVLPPVLLAEPGRGAKLLMDLEAYTAWEAHMVRVLTATEGTVAETALGQLEADLRMVQRWRPGSEPLAAAVAALAPATQPIAAHPATPAVSSAVTSAATLAVATDNEAVVCRYVAARAFASWAAYQEGGVIAVLRQMRRAVSLVREFNRRGSLRDAIRHADLHIMHLDSAPALDTPSP